MDIVTQVLSEALWIKAFKEDMAPQAILLMGLPAAGKSTFINTELKNFFPNVPHVKSFRVLNSDSQLKSFQFQRAKSDYDELYSLDKNTYNAFIQSMSYVSNDGTNVNFPLSYEQFQSILKFNDYWNLTYKSYYASYFGERSKARAKTNELTDKKFSGSDVVIVDTTGQDVGKYLGMFEKTREKGFVNSVVYLEIDPKLSIARDSYRGETEGRSVGKSVILSIASKLPSAFGAMAKNPLVDRYLKFTWNGDVIKGSYGLVKDHKKYPYR